MKNALLILALSCITLGAFAQSNKNTDEKSTAVPASFKGGLEALYSYLAKHTVYPPLALENDIQGDVIVMFVVTKQGHVQNVEVVSKKFGFGLEEEAIRVIKSTSGMWTPAVQDGVPVNMRYRIPIKFKLVTNPPKKKRRKK